MNEFKKCKICNKRFKVQEWKTGKEREECFTCRFIQKVNKENGLPEEYIKNFLKDIASKGGKSTFKKYGKEYFSEISKKGKIVIHNKRVDK